MLRHTSVSVLVPHTSSIVSRNSRWLWKQWVSVSNFSKLLSLHFFNFCSKFLHYRASYLFNNCYCYHNSIIFTERLAYTIRLWHKMHYFLCYVQARHCLSSQHTLVSLGMAIWTTLVVWAFGTDQALPLIDTIRASTWVFVTMHYTNWHLHLPRA